MQKGRKMRMYLLHRLHLGGAAWWKQWWSKRTNQKKSWYLQSFRLQLMLRTRRRNYRAKSETWKWKSSCW